MRYFKSLGSDGWKSAVLKIKMRKKLPAITITLTAVSIFCFLVLAEAFFMMTSGSFNALAAQRTASQAEQNARIEVKRLENLDYAELSYLAEHPRQVMEGVEDGNWESEVTLGPEKNLSEDDNVKIRLAHVSIYRTQDSVSRYDVDVPLTSATGTTPIGSVMTWTSEGKPTTGGVWLECNGQTIPSKYKRLRELIGNKTPDYRGMFLRGYGTSKPYYIHQNDIAKEHSQTFSSGALGEFEQDSIRDSFSGIPNVMTMDARSRILQSWGYPIPPSPVVWWQLPYGYANGMKYTLPSGAVVTNSSLIAKLSYEGKRVWVSTRPPKKYRLHGHGGENASYSLEEYDDTENGEYHDIDKFDWGLDLGYMMKAADEIKPVNVAVRYFIKAR